MIIPIIFIIIIVIIIIKFKKRSYPINYDNITFFEATLGGGKTTMLTRCAITERRKRVIKNFFNPLLNIISWLIPIYNIYLFKELRNYNKKHNLTKRKFWEFPIKKVGTKIYSNYPIYINKRIGFSEVISKNVLYWDFRVKEDCIICLDEVEYLFPSEMKKTDPLYNFCLTWNRHATNALIFAASQSLSGCNVVFRRKVNRCYHLINMSKSLIPFISKVQVISAMVSEDIKTIYQEDYEERQENWHYFKFPKNHFESRYAKKLYNLPKEEIKELAWDYSKLLKRMKLSDGERWKSYYYEFN